MNKEKIKILINHFEKIIFEGKQLLKNKNANINKFFNILKKNNHWTYIENIFCYNDYGSHNYCEECPDCIITNNNNVILECFHTPNSTFQKITYSKTIISALVSSDKILSELKKIFKNL